MAFSVGGLIQGLTAGATGAQEGIAARRKLEREALRERLLQSLQEAQIAHLGAQTAKLGEPPQRRLTPIIDPVSGVVNNYDPTAGTLTPSGGKVGVKPQQAREPRPATVDQTRLADFGTRLLEGHSRMTALERQFPGIGQSVDKKARAMLVTERIPGIGGALTPIIQPMVFANMTAQEREYWNAMQDVGNARLRRASGAQINKEEYDREIRPLVPLFGEDETTVSAKQARRLQAGLLYWHGAGPAAQPLLLSPEAQALLGINEGPETPAATPTPKPSGKYRPTNPYAK